MSANNKDIDNLQTNMINMENNLQTNMINMGNNLQQNQMGLQDQIISLQNQIIDLKKNQNDHCNCKSKYPKNILRKFQINLKSNYVSKQGNILKIKIESDKCILKSNDRYNRKTVLVQSNGDPHEVGGYQEHDYNLHLLEYELDSQEIFIKNSYSGKEDNFIQIDIIDKDYNKEYQNPTHKYEHRHIYHINEINVEDEFLICHIKHIKTFHNKNISNNDEIHKLAEIKKNQKRNDFVHNIEEDVVISFNKYIGSPQSPWCWISYNSCVVIAEVVVALIEAELAADGEEETWISEIIIDSVGSSIKNIIQNAILSHITTKLPDIIGLKNPISETSVSGYLSDALQTDNDEGLEKETELFLTNLIDKSIVNILDFLIDHNIITSSVPHYIIEGIIKSLSDFILAVIAPAANLPPLIASKLTLITELCWMKDFNETLDENKLISSLLRFNISDNYPCGQNCKSVYSPN